MNLSIVLLVVAVILLFIAGLIGFDVFTNEHIFGWGFFGLTAWAAAALVPSR